MVLPANDGGQRCRSSKAADDQKVILALLPATAVGGKHEEEKEQLQVTRAEWMEEGSGDKLVNRSVNRLGSKLVNRLGKRV